MKHCLLRTIFLAIICAALRSAADEKAVTAFDEANKFYAQNKFPEAAAAYEQIIANGSISPVLYFNLGNARFKAGQIGHAITAYREAEKLSPRDPDLQANLRFARNQVQGPTIKPRAWQRWIGSLNLNEWTLLCSTGFWLMFGLLALRQIKPSLRDVLKNWIWLCAAGTAMLLVILAIVLPQNAPGRIAVVTVGDATVRTSPLDESTASFTTHDGAELLVLDHKDDWLQVSDGTQRFGWVKADQTSLAGRF